MHYLDGGYGVMLTQLDGNEKTYELRLSDMCSWRFTAVKCLSSWLEMFAEMALFDEALGGGSYMKKFTFVAKKEINEPPSQFIPGSFIPPIPNLYSQIWHHPLHPDIFVELNTDKLYDCGMEFMNMFGAWRIIHKHYVLHGGSPFHAAFVGLEDNGILIIAPGNTGKTTSFQRLPDYWDKYSDDLALVIKAGTNKYNVHPLPTWSDYVVRNIKTKFRVEHNLPLKGIFFLEQSNKDKVTEIKQGKAAMEIFNSLKSNSERLLPRMDEFEKKDINSRLLDTSFQLSKAIPCYRLKATLHGEFWKEIEKVLYPDLRSESK